MGRVVVLSGGGIKSAVAAGRYAPEHEVILVHVDFSQPAAAAQVAALDALAGSFPSARVVKLTLPHLMELQQHAAAEGARRSAGRPDRAEGDVLSPASVACVMPVLFSMGVQCAVRLAASAVVTGISRFCDASHLGLMSTDARPDLLCELVHAFNIMLESASPRGSKVQVEAPLMDASYAEMIGLAQRFEVALGRTWTCGRAAPRPCRRCDPCKARARAFAEAVVTDPLASPVPA